MKAIIFDTETTGVNQPELVEAAWLGVSCSPPFVMGEDFCQRYRPKKRIEISALATHHIMDEDLVDCPPSSSFQLPQGVEYLVGHNIDYDWNVAGKPNVKRICTLALSRFLWPEADSHSLSAMMYKLERESAREALRNAHSALADVKNTYHVMTHIIHALGCVNSMEDLWRLSEKSRVPTHMPFGKHKGLPIAEVPADYKRWLLGQQDVDPYLVKALKA